MTTKEFTLEDLKRILLAGAGADENVDLDGNIIDTEFAELGYDSVALLETVRRIELEHDIVLDDSVLSQTRTPRALLDFVTAHRNLSHGITRGSAGTA